MSLLARLKREWRFLRPLVRTLRRVSSISGDSLQLCCDDLEQAVDRWPQSPALRLETRTLTYGEFDALANRFAHWARGKGIKRGQTVALLLPNRIDYVAAWFGLSKIGVITALINDHLAGAALANCINLSGADHIIIDDETAAPFHALGTQLKHAVVAWTLGRPRGEERDLTMALRGCSTVRPDRETRHGLTARETALFIFTSGTTGMPKAARITHMRVQLYMRGFAGATGSLASDRIYCALPLYHATGGLCAVGAALLNGGELVIARKFSATNFWPEVIASGATMFVYIGELCRYLVNQPERPEEREHKIRMAFGNGLRPDVWSKLQARFRIPQVLEFYGATEGNVSMFNFDGRVGAIGRVPKYLRKHFNIRLVRFDVEKEEPVRGPDGLCIACKPGEIGECVGGIGASARESYTGYADKAASEKKILRDVFAKGDAYFATGDLMRQDRDGYFYFVDRVGDTFRWKGENVSTSEVEEVLSAVPGVKEVIVYGVQVGDLDGRAGMAGLVTAPGFDLHRLHAEIEGSLPSYAQPLFLRILPEIDTTGTFKYRKLDLVADGFNPTQVKGAVYYKSPTKGYVKLTRPTYAKIVSDELRL